MADAACSKCAERSRLEKKRARLRAALRNIAEGPARLSQDLMSIAAEALRRDTDPCRRVRR